MWSLAEDTLADEDIDALADWLRTHPRLTQGDLVHEFEQEWAAWLGTQHAVMVTSGTTANFAAVAVAARRVGRRRPRIGVASVTWSTNVTPSLLLGHHVTLFDVVPETLGVDPEQACAAMDAGQLDILFVTHLLGFNALDERIVRSAERNGVLLLEDCCESHGARFGSRRIGTYGLMSTFSFYFGHHMSTIEGGIVCTDDDEVADELRLMRAHGLARESARFDDHAGQHPEIDRRFLFLSPGLNFRSTELNAFLGLRQLRTLDERIERRNENLLAFLHRAPDYLWRTYETAGVSSFAFPLIAETPEAAAYVQGVVNRLKVESRPVVAGNLLRQPFLSGHDVRVYSGDLAVADHIHRCGLYVGNGHHVTVPMVDSLIDALAKEQPLRPL
jgi:CDP-6-deoxy-D-xylo-4-hexulose-3-dehydrase